MSQFTLQASDIRSPQQWTWKLYDDGRMFVADHPVSLNQADWHYEAFLDLHGYLSRNAAPDNRRESERKIIADVGRWIGEHVIGPDIGNKLVAAAEDDSVVVHVTVDRDDADQQQSDEDHILYRPLELAYVGDKPLALQDISLVFGQPAIAQPSSIVKSGKRGRFPHDAGPLRMLAVFSLPLGVGALNLRHERYELRRMIRRIATDRGLDFDLRVLQYGVTRDALKQLLRDGPGWDIVHFSGHGLAARLVLENDDGTADSVETTELIELLRPTRKRLKWVTFSSCLSAAATVAETLRWLGLEPERDGDQSKDAPDEDGGETVTARRMPMLANRLARELDCAVLAMRFPVGDRFAIDLGGKLYEGVFSQRQSLERALQLSLPELVAGNDAAYPPLSVGTPALFGGRAAGLTFDPPRRDGESVEVRQSGLALFPPQEERLVGRVDQLSRAQRALASGSEQTGVLLHGMAGAGKTACAKELAWWYEDVERFQYFVWFKAPDVGMEICGALVSLAKALEDQIPGLQMIHLMDRRDELLRFLPRLSDMLRRYSVLIVLDNLESLIRGTGIPARDSSDKDVRATNWRDPAWGDVVDAMLMHEGESRVVLTSRVVPPVGVSEFATKISPARDRFDAAAKLLTLPVHALSLDEAALLARHLPNLGGLLEGRHAAGGIEADKHRGLVLRMLRLVQGHPKLIDLAERQATDPSALAEHLDRSEAASLTGQAPLAAFFESGQSELTDDDFLATLTGWTDAIAAGLSPDAAQLFGFLCCLEEADRQRQIVERVWPRFLTRIGTRSVSEGQANDGNDDRETGSVSERQADDPSLTLRVPMEELYACGLVERRDDGETYGIHPGVAEAGRDQAGKEIAGAVDAELAEYWVENFKSGMKTESQGGGEIVRRAGERILPYQIRRQRWESISIVLEQILHRDKSSETIDSILPLLRHLAVVTIGTEHELVSAGILAYGIMSAGRWQEAEFMTLDIVKRAEEQHAWKLVSARLGDLIVIMRATGRYDAAMEVLERKKQATKNAELGPWTQILDEGWELKLLSDLGRHDEVLTGVQRLRQEMTVLPEEVGDDEGAVPWNVREETLATGVRAAKELKRYDDALAINAEILLSLESRGAGELQIANRRVDDFDALIGTKRFDQARDVIARCRRVFEEHQHHEGLGMVFGALARLECALGNCGRAIAAEFDALRFVYLVGHVGHCLVRHYNLAHYCGLARRAANLHELTQRHAAIEGIAHRLVATLIVFQTHDGRLASAINVLRIDINDLPADSPARSLLTPDGSGFDRVVKIVERIPGVRFSELFAMLPTTRAADGPTALAAVLALVAQQQEKTEENDVND